ncbi:protein hu-li tai shao-like isoform X2 [Tigriopus californicus]|uniref:protein hu-li tai shao-like isoform X2 n=1 Tax=Tigriopus californicus TaxID=6832 RepID=UPI0027DA098C|nr:protein hu-li tai shao-like isoform X2 [Tigriopus californicus]
MAEDKPFTNGNGAATDAESDEEDASKLRPVNIEQDVREMERRKRVEAIMGSKLFREELERVVTDSLRESGAEGITNMLSDMMHVKVGSSGGTRPGTSTVFPINDIRGLDSMGYTKHERALRCKLAAAYRLVDLFGWTQGIYNHITLRVSQDTEHFLINPFGMLFSEITASSLVKIDMKGHLVEGGTTNFGVNVAGFMLHSAIHSARPDLKCIIHVHVPAIVAVSATKCGLLPLCQEACLIGDVSYHNYLGLVVEESERDILAKDLGVHNKVMLLRNHGAICCGETLEEAFLYAHHLVLACETQLKMMPMGLDNLVLIEDDVRRKVFERGQMGGGGVNSTSEGGPDGSGDKKKRTWGVGELEFEALMRNLDNSGYRTGFTFKQPLVKEEPAKPKSDVELPPSVSSLGYLLEEENLYKDGPLRALLANYTKQATKGAGRTKWMNSPNVYQKVEVLETGTPDPKKITKWVADDSPSRTTPIRVDDPNQFVPLGTTKKEFKKIQKAMKEGRRAGGITAGPESKVLDGATWEDRVDSVNRQYAYGDMDYKVGAASKGIIQRDYQHHATVYGSAYAKNPFDNVSSEELQEYQRIIDAKSRNEDPFSPGPGDSTMGDNTTTGDRTYNGDETDGNHTFSEGEGDTSRATDPDSTFSPKKEKKKRSGLRTPSFLKKKKKDKKSSSKDKA